MRRLQTLENPRDRLTLTDTHRRDPKPGATTFQLVQQRRGDPGAGRTERVPERDATTVGIDVTRLPTLVQPRVGEELQDDRGERFVDLDQGDVVPRETGLLEGAGAGLGIPVAHPVRIDARETERDEARTRLQAMLLECSLAREQHRGRAVDDRARVAGRHDAVSLEGRLQRCELLGRGVAAWRLVDGEQHDRTAGADLDRADLVREPSLVARRYGSPVRLEGVLVERFPA